MQVFRIEMDEEELRLEGQQPEGQAPAPDNAEPIPEAAPEPQQPAPDQQGSIDFQTPFKTATGTGFIGKPSFSQQLKEASIIGGAKNQTIFQQEWS